MRQTNRSFREVWPFVGVAVLSALAAGGVMWFFGGLSDIPSFFVGWAFGVFSGVFLHAVWPR